MTTKNVVRTVMVVATWYLRLALYTPFCIEKREHCSLCFSRANLTFVPSLHTTPML